MATITISNTGGNSNATSTWVGGVVPISGDTIVCTATSGQLTINAALLCTTLDFTNYVNTLTVNSSVQVLNGNLILVAGMTITGTGTITCNTTCSLTSNGKTLPCTLSLVGSGLKTFVDNWTVSNLSLSSGNQSNGNNVFITGNLTLNGNQTAGTTTYKLTGTGTWSGNFSLTNPLIINTAGTITLSGNVSSTSASVTLTAVGTLVTTGSTILFNTSNVSGNWSSVNLNNLTFSVGTITLASDIYVLGTLNFSTASTSIINGFTIYLSGNLTQSSIGAVSGTTSINIAGTCTWSSTGTLKNNITFSATSILTISGTVNYNTGTMSDVSGCSVTTTGSNLTIVNSTTINVSHSNFNNVTVTQGTLTLNSLLTVNGTLDIGSASTVTFAGTNGWICNMLMCNYPGRTINYAAGKTYTITGSIMVAGTSASKISFISTSTGALFNVQVGATQDIRFCNATWMNSSGGAPVYTNAGVLSNTTNWNVSGGNWFGLLM